MLSGHPPCSATAWNLLTNSSTSVLPPYSGTLMSPLAAWVLLSSLEAPAVLLLALLWLRLLLSFFPFSVYLLLGLDSPNWPQMGWILELRSWLPITLHESRSSTLFIKSFRVSPFLTICLLTGNESSCLSSWLSCCCWTIIFLYQCSCLINWAYKQIRKYRQRISTLIDIWIG